jgi:hypothetical protein
MIMPREMEELIKDTSQPLITRVNKFRMVFNKKELLCNLLINNKME